MNALQRPGRLAAAIGAVVAVCATILMVLLADTATASVPGRCTENVNVREHPDLNARIVATCERGTEVRVAERRNGFVRLVDLGGWAVQEYVSVNGAPPPAPASTTAPSATPSAGPASATVTPRPVRAPANQTPPPTTTAAPQPARPALIPAMLPPLGGVL